MQLTGSFSYFYFFFTLLANHYKTTCKTRNSLEVAFVDEITQFNPLTDVFYKIRATLFLISLLALKPPPKHLKARAHLRIKTAM